MPTYQRLRDAAVPVALLAVGLGTLPLLDGFSATDRPVSWVAAVLVIVAAGVTAARRRLPGPALAVASVCTSAWLVAGFPYGPILLSFAVCVYSAGRHLALRRAALWAAAALAILLVHTFTGSMGLAGLAPGAAWVIVPFTVGAARRMVVEAQARERAEAERRIADAERLRLSQEVHDVVGHGLAAIQMQADIALHLRETRPAMAHEALAAISAASAEALDELRATLAGVPTSPGLAGVGDLCARIRAAGVTIDLTVAGSPSPLSPGADAAAYRVLQESLTNVLKHASQRRATVTIRHHPDHVALQVTNPAPALTLTPAPAFTRAPGLGLTGMRRRVEQLGGTLTAHPDPPGTFTVHATIPAAAPHAPTPRRTPPPEPAPPPPGAPPQPT
ncbi:sensor histidine kinase, partial [Paractinoplanes deccanensis]